MTSERFSVVIRPEAQRDLQRLSSLAPRFLRRIARLAANPEDGHALTGSLTGVYSLEVSQRGGGYRALYVIDATRRRCVVFIIGPHATVYRDAVARYLALDLENDE